MSEEKKKSKPKILEKILHLSPLRIALLVMALCFFATVKHYRSQRTVDENLDWVGTLERALLDMRFRLRGPRPVSGEIGVLAIDDAAISKFGRFPFTRSSYAKSFENLKKAGVQWIGLDVTFSEPERPLLEDAREDIQMAAEASQSKKGFDSKTFNEYLETLGQAAKGDRVLAESFTSFKNILQGYFILGDGVDPSVVRPTDFLKLQDSKIDLVSFANNMKLEDFPELMMRNVLANTDVVAGENSFQGYLNNEPDTDGTFRQATLVKIIESPKDESGNPVMEPVLVPGLSLALAIRYLNREPNVQFDQVGLSKLELMDPNGEKDSIVIPLTSDGYGRMLINHYGPETTFPYISMADADEGKLPTKVPKILIVGGTALGINDMRASPFSASFFGVEHHTAILENIISKNFMKRPIEAIGIELGILIVSGLFFTFLLQRSKALTSAGILALFCIIYYIVDRKLIFGRGYWLYIGMPYLQSFGIYFGVTLYKYFTEEKEKKKVRGAFQHYLNPAVINQLLENPDKLKLGGEKKELTVFFSDVRGFTTISETLAPDALASLLNEYFTPMTKLILDSNGLLDKYIGDAIMAVWGAPISLPDHADRACEASLKMLDALDELRASWKTRGLPMIDIGMGMNTGFMTVGNMGSDQRFDYTVMGDSVNLGARLEGITKQYGVRTLISQFTRAKLLRPQNLIMREIDSIQVKGKTEPVVIFEVMRAKPDQKSRTEGLAEAFMKGLALYRQQNWKAAEMAFLEGLKLNPEDGPTLEFMKRCKYFSENSPGDNWDGVWVMKTK